MSESSQKTGRAAHDPAVSGPARAGKPRVVFYLAGLFMGGAERHTLDLRQRLADLGYPTAVIAHDARVAAGLSEVAKADYVEILGLHGMLTLTEWPRMLAAIRRSRPDVLITVNEGVTIRCVAARALGATKAKIACTFHSTLMLPRDERRLPLFRWAARSLDALVYVSRNQAQHWTERNLKTPRPVAIPNGVDLDRFPDQTANRPAAKARLGLSEGDFVFGVLASFRVEKNHRQAVDALKALLPDVPNAKLLFIGDGAERPAIERYVDQLGVRDQVVFAGEHADVRPVVAALDVGLICSTLVETFSIAALEQLASGLPMVMSDIGGASEIVEDGVNGFLFPRGDTKTLVQRLRTLADPATLKAFQQRARPSAQRYSIDRMLQQYVDLIDDLAGVNKA